MKGIKRVLLLVFLIPLLVCFQACNNDENPPVITLSSPDLIDGVYTTNESGKVEISVSITAPNGFKTLLISFSGLDAETQEIEATEAGQSTFNTNFEFEEIIFGSSGSFTIVFQVIDDADQSSKQTITVKPSLPTIVLTEDNPDIDNGTLFAKAGRFFNIRYRYTFPGGFGQFKIVLTIGSSTSETLVKELPPTQGLAVTDAINYSFTQEFLGEDIDYFLEVRDIQGNSASLEIPVELSQPPVAIYEMVLLELPSEDKNSKSFFSTNIGKTYSVNEISNAEGNVAQDVDFGFFYDDTGGASLTGPGNFPTTVYNLGPNGENWPTLNILNFRTTSISETEFNALDTNSQSEIDAAFDNATGDNKLIIEGIQVGDIISFRTDLKNGIKPKGILKATNIVGPGEAGSRIEMIVKINL